jgi:AAA+ superfamily predicted ATPase
MELTPMLFSKRIKLIILVITSGLSITHLTIKTSTLADSITYSQTAQENIVEAIIDTTQKQLEIVHTILSDLSFIINDNQIKTIKKKKSSLANIQHMMRDIESKKNILVVSNDLHTLQFIIHFTHNALAHIQKAFDTHFTEFTPFESEQAIEHTRTNNKNISLEKLEEIIIDNEHKVTDLKHSAANAGLAWYNKSYRLCDKYLFQHVREYGMLGGIVGLGALYTFWHMYPALFKNSAMGTPYTPETLAAFIKKQKRDDASITFFGRAERFVACFWRDLLPIGSLLVYLIKDQVAARWKSKTQPWLHKYITTFHYKMMGGSYVEKITKLDGIGKKVLFDDLIGLEHAKNECNYLINYMADPESYIRRGQRINHILFTGPPRTGKTELAKALYYEIKTLHSEAIKFIPLPAVAINIMGIDRCLDIMKSWAPCIVFIDEIDLLNVQRSGKNETLSALLQGMSGLDNDSDPTKQVIIIGATNKPEYLDFALMTHGRFGKVIHFEYPNQHEREQFFTRHMKKLSLNLGLFNCKKLSRETDGRSYESLKTLMDHGILKARLQGQSLTQLHLEAALDEELRRIVSADLKQIPDHEKRILAAHFAGHALAIQLLDGHTKLAKITIKPIMVKLKEELIGNQLWRGALGKNNTPIKEQERYEYGKMFTCHDHDTINICDSDERIKLCKAHLAGIAAEKIMIGSCGHSCHCKDKEQALEIIKPIVFEGFDPDSLPKNIAAEKYARAIQLLDTYEQEVIALLLEYKDTLETIALELYDEETLEATMVQEIIEDTRPILTPAT